MNTSSNGIYWYDPDRGKAWPFDGHYGGDDKLIKLVDQSVIPKEFICFWKDMGRPIRFKDNGDGTFDQWVWNNEWVWDDNVGRETAEQYYSDPATLVATYQAR